MVASHRPRHRGTNLGLQGLSRDRCFSQRAPIHRWECPASAWQRLHVDFAGHMLGRMYLVILDAYSKWPEIVEIKTATAEETVTQRAVIARMGIPHQIVYLRSFQEIYEGKRNQTYDWSIVSPFNERDSGTLGAKFQTRCKVRPHRDYNTAQTRQIFVRLPYRST